MDKETLNKKEGNVNKSFSTSKKIPFKQARHSNKFSSTFINQKDSIINNIIKELNKYNNEKKLSRKDVRNLSCINNDSIGLKSQKLNRKYSNKINMKGLSLHDALYLGFDLNNKGIRANDISCYLSNTSNYQPEETKYKLIEKNIQNKLLDISMEIFEKKKSKLEDEFNINNNSFTLRPKKLKKKSSKKLLSQIFKERKSKSTTKFLPNFQKSLSIKSHDTTNFIYLKELQLEKNRKIVKTKVLYDSMAEDESDENFEEDGYGFSPESLFMDIFDCIMLICSLFSLFYVPYRLASSKLIIQENEYIILSLIYFTEIIYILDLIFGFFRWYYNNEWKLVKNNIMILKNYLFGNFLFDLIEAIPFYTIYKYSYMYRDSKIDYNILFNENYFALKMLVCFKAIKIFKISNRKNNRAFYYFNKKSSDNYISEKIYDISIFSIITISVLNIFISFHIYMAKLSYPNWILSSKLQDASFIDIYIASLYFIMATMTSVGYGDIVCINKEETFFQIILLSVGIVAYSWIISTVGDYVKNESRATIKYNKDMLQLEEIRITYPNMPFKLYNKIHQHLQRLLKQQEKFDSNILINSLPYTLKNTLLFEIHKEVITKFIFFNGCENSDFILRVLTHFIPLSSKKNAFLIKEGDIIENIFFVKDGRLALEAAIDLDNVEESIEKYLEYQFEEISSIIESGIEKSIKPDTEIKEKAPKKRRVRNSLELFNIIDKQTENIADVSYMHESHVEEEIGKCDLNGENEEIDQGNHQFLHILDVLKNEHFGELYMFLNRPSPLSLRVKSKRVDLFLLRKKDAVNIKKDYPNIWKRINDKSMHNMKSVKALTKKVINRYCKLNGIIQEKDVVERSNHLFKETDININKDLNSPGNISLKSSKNKKKCNIVVNKKNTIVSKNSMSPKNRRKIRYAQTYVSSYGKKKGLYKRRGTVKDFGFKMNKKKHIKKRISESNIIIRKKDSKNILWSDFNDENKEEKNIKKGKTLNLKKNKNAILSQELNKSPSISFSQSDKSSKKNINKCNTNKDFKKLSSTNFFNNKNSSKSNHFGKVKKPLINTTISSIGVSNKNLLFKNMNQIANNQNKKRENSFINSLNNNFLFLNNTQITEKSNNRNSIIFNDNYNFKANKISNLTTESSIKLEIIASYKNINKIAKGKYLQNKQFQKATQKFISYYVNTIILNHKEKLNEGKDEKESSFDISVFEPYSEEESSFQQKNSNNYRDMKINSDNHIKEFKLFKDNANSKELRSDLTFKNKEDEEKEKSNKKNIIKKSEKSHFNKILNIKNIYSNRNNNNQLISEINSIIIKTQNPQKDSMISNYTNKENAENNKYYKSFEEENIIDNMDNKHNVLWGKNYNSNAARSNNSIYNNDSNSNFLQIGKNIIAKKEKKEEYDKLNNKKKDEKINYNSSQNIINNKSSKNINEVNINFTNNFCLII